MNKRYLTETCVGIFVLAGILAFFGLAFKVSGLTSFSETSGYDVTAEFANIGNLKVRAPVSIGGVRIGEVKSITLNSDTFMAEVVLRIQGNNAKIPARDTTARILTEGLLGSNYISIEPGFEDGNGEGPNYLHEGSRIDHTQPALILENLIGQFLFNIKK